ncbi:hypothetical protein C0992_007013 [Termitomyces sp. T32_za158]|nr:hypothetical protein C0992_007013 [Termitomyces sp. T32_za158]
MGITNWLVLLVTHPNEFRTLVQFYIYHERKRDITSVKEHPTSGWNRESMRRCWAFLDQTSRSFSAVIKELDGDLARTICIFYLVLRGLDTIEDDMTIPDHIKQPILRSFHKHTVTPGWKYDGCGPNEKDRQLLVEYDVVVDELNSLDPSYRDVIVNIAEKMETGMADYAHKAATTGSIYLDTIAEYDLYCHYVAGLVGEGLSGIFSASQKEAPWIKDQLELSNSMGLLLQKTNIIRDYREDVNDHRYFWPREIWGRKEYGFSEMKDMYAPHSRERAMWAQSGMVVDALRHAIDALDYLRLLKNQSVFNFCAIPASMAIATLELCFMNPVMFDRNIKIRKAEAARASLAFIILIIRSTNPREVATIFVEYARKIHAKAVTTDPNFLRISVACGKIEQWLEQHYPSHVLLSTTGVSFNEEDPRTRIIRKEQELDFEIAKKKRVEGIRDGHLPLEPPSPEVSKSEIVMWIGGVTVLIFVLAAAIVYLVFKFVEEN